MTAAAEQAASLPPEQTVDAFWDTWGEVSGYDRAQLDAIWYDAESLYSRLPYHDFEHATGVLWKCMELADLCEANGVAVNRRLLVAAAPHHDSGYFEDHVRYGYDSKEAYAGDILVALHERYGLSAEEAETARNMIMKTKLGERPVTLEEKILVRADLANVSAGYEEFLANNDRMRRESELLNPKNYHSVSFIGNTLKILCKYFSNDLRLGDFEDYSYRRRAIENLRRLANETAWSEGRSALGYIQGLHSDLVNKMLIPRLPLRRKPDKSDS